MSEPAPPADPSRDFRWQDGERLIRFGRGAVSDAPDLLRDGYTLLTTPRARGTAPEVVERAGSVHDVPSGRVDEIAAELRGDVDGELLVALGGGRVIDVAKALAAADPPRRVAAIPTTLSAAEMTRIHRQAAGATLSSGVRPAIVINDPALSASQPVQELAASAGNALGHAAEAPLTPLANPVATLSALEAARLLHTAFAGEEAPDRDALALGALLSGYAIDAAGYGLHHVLSQTLVRVAGVAHGPANVVMLPHTLRALAHRFPDRIERLGATVGGDAVTAAAALAQRFGTARLRELGVVAEQLGDCADAANERPELDLTPPRADREEIVALYETAW